MPSPKKRNINVGLIVGGTLGGVVAAIFAVIGVFTFVQRRRRRSRPKLSIWSSSNGSVDAGSQMIVTPWHPNSSEATEDSGFSADQQSSVIRDPEVEMAALHRRSFSLPAPSPLLPPEGSVVGLSDEELARLRAEAPSFPLPHNLVSPLLPPEGSVPVGLSGKELARLRTEGLSPSLPHNVVSPLLPPEGSVPVGLSDKALARLRAEGLSSPLPHNIVSPLLPPEGSVPVGLSGKELARLRAEGLSSSLTHNVVSPPTPPEGSGIPAGLSDEELARLRAEAPSSPLPYDLRISASNATLDTSSPTAVAELGVGTLLLQHTRRLRSDLESLERRVLEMDQIRGAGFISGARSNYTSGDE